MKNFVKIVAVMAIACVVTLKAYDKQNVKISDVLLSNVEALADKSEIDNGGFGIVCSAKCNDGIGRCWVKSGGNFCVFSGSEADNCTGYGCRLYDGTIYY